MTRYTATQIKELRLATGASFLDCRQAIVTHSGNLEQAIAALQAHTVEPNSKIADRPTPEGLVVMLQRDGVACLVKLSCETDFVAKTAPFKAFAHQLAELVLGDELLTSVEALLLAEQATNEPVLQNLQALIGAFKENIVLSHVSRLQARENEIVQGYVHAGATSGFEQGEGRIGTVLALKAAERGVVSAEMLTAIAHKLALHITTAAPQYIAVSDIPAEVMAAVRTKLLTELATLKKTKEIHDRILAGKIAKFQQENCLLAQPFALDEGVTIAAWMQAQSQQVGTELTITSFSRVDYQQLVNT